MKTWVLGQSQFSVWFYGGCITVDTCANWRRQERAPTTWYSVGDSNVTKPWLVSGAGEGKEYAGRLCPFYQFACEAEAALKIRIL